MNGNMEEMLEYIEKCIEEKRDGYKIITDRDFNAKKGREKIVEEKNIGRTGYQKGRNSKDEKINREKKRLVDRGK